MSSPSRRELLGTTVAGLAGAVTGCSTNAGTTTSTATGSPSTSQQTPTASPSSSSTPVQNGSAAPLPSCPEEYVPVRPRWVVHGPGPLAGFDLTLNGRDVAPGDTLSCELRNVAREENESGNRRKYDVQHEAEGGWHTVFGTKREVYRTDEAVTHEPGSGFTWEFELTRDGLSNVVENDEYYACGRVEAGTYRFVYWGITPEIEAEEDYETDYALGVPFTVTGG